ncbi:5'/3'-nucleotidase SurE [Nocardia nova]|uniref:5'-nucleotidase n=2 Tax=Nocardia nova TaxID=37330 RepID=A0A2S6AKE6_9NOCA|nr:5'/3'-nucleotidase SurE [Nocardia nova]PPJ35696.1 5'/3'-nucleotidase SurE [Nocardia nova]
MRIMVTNDDGIGSSGLRTLARQLHAAGYEIEVAAPLTDHSGSGSSLGTLEHGAEIAYQETRFPELPEVRVIGFDAPPAFGVMAYRFGLFGPPPELVVSGVNPGHNTGRLVLHSSTVGAALCATALGLRAVAVSCGFAPVHRFDTAAAVAVAAVGWLADRPEPTMLNLNVPDVELQEIKGVRTTTLAPRGLMGLSLERSTEAIRLLRFDNTERLGVGTDSAAVRDGFVALSVLRGVATESGPDGHDAASAIEDTLLGRPLPVSAHD